MIHDTQSAQISQKQDEPNLYAIMKTMCPPDIYISQRRTSRFARVASRRKVLTAPVGFPKIIKNKLQNKYTAI